MQAAKLYSFVIWCYENYWEPYDDPSRWINDKLSVISVDQLWSRYFAELPEDVKNQL